MYAKFRYYNTVIKPECLSEAETLILNKVKNIENKECRQAF